MPGRLSARKSVERRLNATICHLRKIAVAAPEADRPREKKCQIAIPTSDLDKVSAPGMAPLPSAHVQDNVAALLPRPAANAPDSRHAPRHGVGLLAPAGRPTAIVTTVRAGGSVGTAPLPSRRRRGEVPSDGTSPVPPPEPRTLPRQPRRRRRTNKTPPLRRHLRSPARHEQRRSGRRPGKHQSLPPKTLLVSSRKRRRTDPMMKEFRRRLKHRRSKWRRRTLTQV